MQQKTNSIAAGKRPLGLTIPFLSRKPVVSQDRGLVTALLRTGQLQSMRTKRRGWLGLLRAPKVEPYATLSTTGWRPQSETDGKPEAA